MLSELFIEDTFQINMIKGTSVSWGSFETIFFMSVTARLDLTRECILELVLFDPIHKIDIKTIIVTL